MAWSFESRHVTFQIYDPQQYSTHGFEKLLISIGRPLQVEKREFLTSDKSFQHDGVVVVHDADEALMVDKDDPRELYIAGGEKVYTLFLPVATLYSCVRNRRKL